MAILYKKLSLPLGKFMVVVQSFDCNILNINNSRIMQYALCGLGHVRLEACGHRPLPSKSGFRF